MFLLKLITLVLLALNAGVRINAQAAEEVHLRSKPAEEMLQRAVEFFEEAGLYKACASFAHDARWRIGPLSVFVWDVEGRTVVDNGFSDYIWLEQPIQIDFFGERLVPQALLVGQQGGWIAYRFLNSIRHAYVKTVTYRGRTYLVGASLFSEAPSRLAPMIAKAIRRYWDRLGITKTLEIVNNPIGPLVQGNIYGIVMDTSGLCWASGDDPLLIGRNLLDEQAVGEGHARGFREVINAFTNGKVKNHWLSFVAHDKVHRIYSELYADKITRRDFIIMIRYFPEINNESIYLLADQSEALIKKLGTDQAVKEFNRQMFQAEGKRIIHEDLHVVLLDKNAVVLFDSNPASGTSYIGRNLLEYVDDKNRPFNRLLIDQLKTSTSAWVNRFIKHALERIYGRRVSTAQGEVFIIVGGYFPSNDDELTKILVEEAALYLKNCTSTKNCLSVVRALRNPESIFIKGDKQVFAYDSNGICWIDGMRLDTLWTKDPDMGQIREGWVDRGLQRIYTKRLKFPVAPQKSELFVLGSSYHRLEGEEV